MRIAFYVFFIFIPAILGGFAYKQNYKTRDLEAHYNATQSELRKTREALRVYNTEWAYLNRPDRLRALVQINDEYLGLFPMGPEHFATLEEIPLSIKPQIASKTASLGEINDQ